MEHIKKLIKYIDNTNIAQTKNIKKLEEKLD
jgi:hypothetical protein